MGIKFKLNFINNLILFIACIMIFIQPVTILASQDGSGGGPGPSMPLELTSSTPADGSTDITTDVTFTLQYSHNVADVAIRENNAAAISVATSTGSPVQAVISFSDTFALPYRQQVYITLAGLQPYTTYIITVGPTFMSRNGYKLGTTDSLAETGTYSDKITFTTGAGTIVQQENSEPVNSNQTSGSSSQNNVSENSAQSSKTSGNAESDTVSETTQVTSETLQNTDTEDDSTELQETNKSSNVSNLKPGKVYDDHTSIKIVVLVVVIAVILIAGGVTIYFRKKKNGQI